MNIFILDNDIEKCAQAHVDKHVVKMILESAQLLCTAVNYYAGEQVTPYKTSHVNHPCAVWVREELSNFCYLLDLMNALNKEYRRRFNKQNNHKSVDVLVKSNIWDLAMKYYPYEIKPLTPFAICMPEEYKVVGDAVQSYRNYYNGAKRDLHKWTNREKPEWIV
jgi:hypothetical protein